MFRRFISSLVLIVAAAQWSVALSQTGQDSLAAKADSPVPIVRSSSHATLFGVGRVNHLDTYLSPSEYKGPQLTFLHETFRTLRRNENVLFQTLTQGEFSYTHNPAETAHEMGGAVRYDFGWGRQWKDVLWKGLNLSAIGLAGGDLGFLYNNRNGNNPAQAHVGLRLTAALRADYHFRIRRQRLALHYQAHLPLLGMAFMPQYGQSYYDIFDRGNFDRNIRCTHPGNALSMRQLFTVDIPIRHARLRLGYLSDLRQLNLNGVKQHQYSRSVVIGYVRELDIKR